jgi:hypothetical protein
MGSSSDGILAYGYDMGDDFGIEYDADPKPAWYDDEDEDSDLGVLAEAALVAASAFPDAESLGLKVAHYGHCDGGGFLLVAVVHEAYGYSAKRVDPVVPDDADARLAWAVEVLGLTVTEPPGWILASTYG